MQANSGVSLKFYIIAICGLYLNTCYCDHDQDDSDSGESGGVEIHNTTTKGGPVEMISSDPNNVKFFLYPDHTNPEYKERLILGNLESIQTSSYNSSIPLKVLIHGFMSNSTDTKGFIDRVKGAYLEVRTPANIVCVDWGYLSTVKDRLPILPYYHSAVKNVQLVGKLVAEFLIFLIENGFISSPSQIHLVGFSLGAHVSGVTGYHVLQNLSIPIQRITGLDPAGPAFKNVKGRDLKLDSSDANFVDVTHTNQGDNGYRGTLGHADYYPNGGGPEQPSCLKVNVTEPSNNKAPGICAHSFAYHLFEESIKTKSILACKCDASILLDVPCSSLNSSTCQPSVVFGEYCPQSARGKFYFKT